MDSFEVIHNELDAVAVDESLFDGIRNIRGPVVSSQPYLDNTRGKKNRINANNDATVDDDDNDKVEYSRKRNRSN